MKLNEVELVDRNHSDVFGCEDWMPNRVKLATRAEKFHFPVNPG
jgi:hypothetical protein